MSKEYMFGYIDDEGDVVASTVSRAGDQCVYYDYPGRSRSSLYAPVASAEHLRRLRNTASSYAATAQLLEDEIKAQEDAELRELADDLKIAFINSMDSSKWIEVARAARNHFRDNPIGDDE